MTDPVGPDLERRAVIWRLGDPWRDLRDEIVGQDAVTFVTENGSSSILAVADGYLMRSPGRRSGPLRGDGKPYPLNGVLVATPCGFVLALRPVTRLRFTSRAVLILAGVLPDWQRVPPLASTVHDRAVEATDLIDHPPDPCGARFCIRHA